MAAQDGRDPAIGRAARTAALVALPVALLAGVAVYSQLGRAGRDGDGPAPGASADAAAAPQATGPVEVPAPALAERPRVVCRALLSQLPQRLRDRPQRPVTAGAEQNAAWGDPPITLACGTTAPPVPADAQLWLLDGVCWYQHDGTAWTTVDREVPVTVTVPAGYAPAGQWVIEFAGPVVASVPSATTIPAGCH